MLRPERVRLGDGERRDGHNVLDARITDVIYQGDTVLVQAVRPDGSRISARGIATASGLGRVPAVGDVAPFGFSAQDAVLVADDVASPGGRAHAARDARTPARPTRAACAATSCANAWRCSASARRRCCW